MRELIAELLRCGDPEGDAGQAMVAADWCLTEEDLPAAAAMLDRAFGWAPDDASIAARRRVVLDRLSVTEHGIVWRYVPAGTFRMGSDTGEADERPVHPVYLDAFHLAEVPSTWASVAAVLGWPPPPDPPAAGGQVAPAVWLQYCETESPQAGDWHAHLPPEDGKLPFGGPPGRPQGLPYRYDTKPMVAVGPELADVVARQMSTATVHFGLPTEAQWEKAARGGRIGARYPWGDDPPSADRCDGGHFGDFHVAPSRSLPPNDYGLYAMCGGVWEWTDDGYDALSYHLRANDLPHSTEDLVERVLRGGSFTDCARATTVSFRMSHPTDHWMAPNLGFRLRRAVDVGSGLHP